MKHTQEPWQIDQQEDNGLYVIVDFTGDEIGNYDGEYSKEDAQRIVYCINACEGLTNEQLESGYIQKLIAEHEEYNKIIADLTNKVENILNTIKQQAG